MRYLSVLIGVALVTGLSSGRGNGQATGQRAADAPQRAADAPQRAADAPQRAADTPAYEPFSKHHDTRFGHDHFYPDRGAIVREVSKEATVVNYAGLAFRFHDGIWYEPRGPTFMVAAPPIGLIVPSLPPFATLLARNGQTYIYCNDTYYRPRPDVNGFEVANDPTEATFRVATESGAAAGTGAVGATSGVAATELAGVPASTHPAAAPALEESAKVSAPVPLAATTAATPASAPTAPPPAVPDATLALGSHPAPTLAPLPAAIPAQPATAQDSSGRTKGSQVVLYPRNGQSTDQQAKDRYECYRFAVAQTGFDPMRAGGAANSNDYERAQSACFDGRGYTVR